MRQSDYAWQGNGCDPLIARIRRGAANRLDLDAILKMIEIGVRIQAFTKKSLLMANVARGEHMKHRFRVGACVIAGVCIFLGFDQLGHTRTQSTIPNTVRRETFLTIRASGTFEVKLNPQDEQSGDATLGRMTIVKQIHGDLEGTSTGQMLTAGTGVPGSSGVYVAIEKVSGTLHGRKGTFILYHTGVMTRGAKELNITVAPDSGTGELGGLAGKMAINIEGSKHSYDFEYTLTKTP